MPLALWQKGVQNQVLWTESLLSFGGQEIRFPKAFLTPPQPQRPQFLNSYENMSNDCCLKVGFSGWKFIFTPGNVKTQRRRVERQGEKCGQCTAFLISHGVAQIHETWMDSCFNKGFCEKSWLPSIEEPWSTNPPCCLWLSNGGGGSPQCARCSWLRSVLASTVHTKLAPSQVLGRWPAVGDRKSLYHPFWTAVHLTVS